MSDPMLFPFLDVAVRVIAVLVLCAIPLLIPMPSTDRATRSARAPVSARQAMPSD